MPPSFALRPAPPSTTPHMPRPTKPPPSISSPSTLLSSESPSPTSPPSSPSSASSPPSPSHPSTLSSSSNSSTTCADPHLRLFSLLLDADAVVDETKLRRAASSGVPAQLRPQVWNLLLGLTAPDRSLDLALSHRRQHEYVHLAAGLDVDPTLARRVRRQLTRSRALYNPSNLTVKNLSSSNSLSSAQTIISQPHSSSLTVPSTNLSTTSLVRANSNRVVDTHAVAQFARVLSAYLRDAPPRVEFDDRLVCLLAPLLETLPTEADAHYAFSTLMTNYHPLFTSHGLRDAVSQFRAMFRTLHPELYDHFVAEEVDIHAWATNWLRGLLVEQLPRKALLRLWDSYFATVDGLALHPFVCLVFLHHLTPELHDCDDAECIRSVLSSVPPLDIDLVIAHAVTTRDQLRELGIM